ncbi:MAG: metal ABC transporter permease [Treponema sp.]|nr:metal ABC transporter permease [Treponema sp.]
MINTIITLFTEMFSYAFLVRAFVVGTLVSVCAALLGVSLVLKRYSMIGDGLSHVGFGSLALATAVNAAPLAVSIPVVIAAAVLLLRLGEKHLIKGDAAIALVSASSLAVGVVIISQTTGMNTDVCNYLFGSILAMSKTDVQLSIILSITVFVLFILFYHKLFAVTFDETFAKTAGVTTAFFNMLIAFLTAITIVLGMRMMGAMLISALIIFPALTAKRVFKTFRSVSVCAVCVSISCYFTGVTLSYVYAVPTGASVVMVNIAAFAVFSLFKALAAGGIAGGKAAVKTAVSLVCVLLIMGCRPGRTIPSGIEGVTQAETTTAKAARDGIKKIAPRKGDIVEIKEKLFIAQTNDVYLNPEEYLGKTIKLEGLFKREGYESRSYCFVIRYGPGCCGSDGNAGFEVAWDDRGTAYPAIDSWVGATGILKRYEEDGFPYLYLALSELTVLPERGAEFVTQ